MQTLHETLFSSITAVFALAACSSDSGGGGPLKPCNDLVHNGPVHSVALVSSGAPRPTGGTISEGNYVLTTARLFSVPGSVDIQRQIGASLAVRGDVIEQVTQVDGVTERRTFKFSVSNAMLSLADSCAGDGVETHGFSATPTELELLSPELGTPYTRHHIFSKRL